MGYVPFKFPPLYDIGVKINETYLWDTVCYKPYSTQLANYFVKQHTGEGKGRSDWTSREPEDIFIRLMTWKAPLLQLFFQFPRPPLRVVVESLSIFHLMGAAL